MAAQSGYSKPNDLVKHSVVLIDRRTNEVVPPKTDTAVTFDEELFRIPPPLQEVWRYLDASKFFDLLETQSLYFRRSDCQADALDGCLSEANLTSHSDEMLALYEGYGIRPSPLDHFGHNGCVRHRYFLNCWHINDAEHRDMWRLYAKNADSVAIVSRVWRLHVLCEWHPMTLGMVRYESQNVRRPDWFSWAPLLFKDLRYKVERELRLILHAPVHEEIHLARDAGRKICIPPEFLVEGVVTHPHASPSFKRQVKRLVQKHLPSARISTSRLKPNLW